MGTTSEKLTYLNTTKEKIKDSINLTGANLTSEDTFRSYAIKLKKGYIDIINNGIDTLYNNFPKVSGIGSNLSLAPTYEAPMKLNEIQGSTLQDGTPTPDTPVEIQSVTGLQNVNVTGKNLFNINGTITQGTLDKYNNGFTLVKGTNRVIRFVLPKVLPAGTYTLSYDTINVENVSGNYFYVSCQYTNTNIGILSDIILNDSGATFTTTGEFDRLYFFIAGNQSNDATITIDNVQFELGSSNTDYEEYKSNTYEVNLGKNIWSVGNKNVGWATNYVDVKNMLNTLSEGTYSITLNFKVTEIVKEKTNNYYGFTFHNSNGHIYNKKNTNSNINVDDNFVYTYTFTISSSQVGNFTSAYFYGFGNDADDVTARSLMYDCQLEKGNTSTSFSPYFTPIELNKIGDYKDSIKKSTGKNLFDKDNASLLNAYINSSSSSSDYKKIISNNNARTLYIPCKSNTTYTISKIASQRFIIGSCVNLPDINTTCTNETHNNTATSLTITTGANDKYLVVFYYLNGTDTLTEQAIRDTLMIQEGSIVSPYEPYGKVWYVEKNIGKVVLDSNLSSVGSTNFSNVYQIYANVMNISYLIGGFCDNFKFNNDSRIIDNNNANIWLSNNQCALRLGNESARDRFYVKSTNFASANELKAYFNTNPTALYYVLATPEYTEITNTELIEDLETLYTAKSQEGTTNISITSEDLEMILNVSALKGDA